MKTKATILGLSLLMALSVGPALARGKLSDGLSHLNYGRYPEAVVALSEAAETNPENPRVHYYLANALAYLGMYGDAVEEYSLAYYIDPHGKYAGYSQMGMKRFGAAARNSINSPGEFMVPETRGMSEYNQLKNSLAQIHRQINAQKSRESMNHMHIASQAIRTSALHEAAIRKRAIQEIEDIRASSGRLNKWQQAEISEINRLMTVRANFVRQSGQLASSRTMGKSLERSTALERSAAGIERQLAARPSRSGVILQPLGTSLYVRNYEHLESPSLKATACKLNPR